MNLHFFPCAAVPLTVDRRYNDSSPHILVSVNPLCQEVRTVTVTFGIRSNGECAYQQSNISKEVMETPLRFDIPEDLVGDEVEYCSRVVLRDVQGVVVGMYYIVMSLTLGVHAQQGLQ